MSRLKLSNQSKQLLAAQVRLTGTFHHDLKTAIGTNVQATTEFDQCTSAIHLAVAIGGTRNSITMDRKHRNNGRRAARFIEACANGGVESLSLDEAGEHELATDAEIMLRHAVRTGKGSYYPRFVGIEDLRLTVTPTQRGTVVATLETDDASAQILLPRSPGEAYAVLAEHLERFVAGNRLAMTA
ncbi:hypothetical protein [Pseudomonas chlororaphis]|uniref:hypothetical protein n=1 Tax=Pseudomonas chlororaphis TaxID=587753 RepID=UPI003C18B6A3